MPRLRSEAGSARPTILRHGYAFPADFRGRTRHEPLRHCGTCRCRRSRPSPVRSFYLQVFERAEVFLVQRRERKCCSQAGRRDQTVEPADTATQSKAFEKVN